MSRALAFAPDPDEIKRRKRKSRKGRKSHMGRSSHRKGTKQKLIKLKEDDIKSLEFIKGVDPHRTRTRCSWEWTWRGGRSR